MKINGFLNIIRLILIYVLWIKFSNLGTFIFNFLFSYFSFLTDNNIFAFVTKIAVSKSSKKSHFEFFIIRFVSWLIISWFHNLIFFKFCWKLLNFNFFSISFIESLYNISNALYIDGFRYIINWFVYCSFASLKSLLSIFNLESEDILFICCILYFLW